MTSDRQYTANRQNALRSTAPRTASGRIRSSQNATTHGLTATRVVLDGEDEEEFQNLQAAIRQEFEAQKPRGALELQLIAQVAATLWRLRRVPEIETALFDYLATVQQNETESAASDPFPFKIDTSTLTAQAGAGARFGRVCDMIVNGGDALGKIARYEAALMRKFEDLLEKLDYQPATAQAQRIAYQQLDDEEGPSSS